MDILLARNLDMSRREIARLIRNRRVRDPAGELLDDPRVNLTPTTLPVDVVVDGRTVRLHHRIDVLQHKPLGVVTALRDARHATAFDVLPPLPLRRELRAVGRLDKDTTGLLLWTTDGALVHRLTHPRYAIARVYEAALAGPFRDPDPTLVLEDGHRPRIESFERPAREDLHPGLVVPPHAKAFARIGIVGGRFHEVRRIFAALGTEVLGLCRTQYGRLVLPTDLPPGGAFTIDLKTPFANLHPEP